MDEWERHTCLTFKQIPEESEGINCTFFIAHPGYVEYEPQQSTYMHIVTRCYFYLSYDSEAQLIIQPLGKVCLSYVLLPLLFISGVTHSLACKVGARGSPLGGQMRLSVGPMGP
jgi:hypothetical protein